MLRRPRADRAAPAVIMCLAGVLLVGCSGEETAAGPTQPATPTGRVLQGAAPGEANTTLTAIPEPPDEVVEADVTFVQMMLRHHAQALEMTTLVPERTSREDVPLFAERIELSQEDEMALMQDWLRQRGETVFDLEAGGAHAHGGGQMRGMLTPEQLVELEEADGEDFDRLFLQYMYRHHEGAVAMVEDLYEQEGAQDSWVFQLAKEIDGDQRIEMDRMVGMLADLGSEPLPPQEG